MLNTSRNALLNRSLTSRIHGLCNGKVRSESMIRKFSGYSTGTQNPSLLVKRPILSDRKVIPSISSRFLSSKTTYDPLLDKNAQSASISSQNPTTNPIIIPDTASGNAWDPNFIESSNVQESITPHIGYLHELGLNYGWGPTSLLQWFIEHIQVYSGLPWYAVIPLSAIAVRLCLFPLYIRASHNGAKLQVVMPLIKVAQERLKVARTRGNQQAMMEEALEMRRIKKHAGASTSMMFLPILVQFPLAFGAFKLLRGMADIPVPGLQNGGIFWITDLTIPDPYYILPFATSAIMYVSMKLGTEVGTHSAEMKQAMSIVPKFLAPVSFVLTSFFPAALTLHFCMGSILAYCQTRLMQNAAFRRAVGIAPFPKTAPIAEDIGSQPRFLDTTINSGAERKTGFLERMLNMQQQQRNTIKDGTNAIQRVAENALGRSFDPGANKAKNALKKAEAYELKRSEEIEAEKRQQRQQKHQRRPWLKKKNRNTS